MADELLHESVDWVEIDAALYDELIAAHKTPDGTAMLHEIVAFAADLPAARISSAKDVTDYIKRPSTQGAVKSALFDADAVVVSPGDLSEPFPDITPNLSSDLKTARTIIELERALYNIVLSVRKRKQAAMDKESDGRTYQQKLDQVISLEDDE